MSQELQLTIEQRIQRINETTEQVKTGFMVIASDMAAIAEDPEYLKKDKAGNVKVNRKGEVMFDGPRFYAFMEERTGYTRQHVNRFIDAHTAMGNLIDYVPECKIAPAGAKMQFPEAEWQIRPLATKTLNADPALQAEIWTEVVIEADGAEISEKMVRDKVKEKCGGSKGPEIPQPVFEKSYGNSPLEKEVAKKAMTILKRELSKIYHPDKGGTDEQQQTVNFLIDEFERYLIINPEEFAGLSAYDSPSRRNESNQ